MNTGPTSPNYNNNNNGTPTTPPTSLKEKAIDFAVLNYLKKRGYQNAEASFKQELNLPVEMTVTSEGGVEIDKTQDIAQYLLLYQQRDDPKLYLESYSKLRNWIHSSLDIYKNELLSILYPVFVHSYIDLITKGYPKEARELMETIGVEHEDYFGADLRSLRGISNTDQLRENELVHLFRNNRWNSRMCSYSYELLMTFLHQSKNILLLSLINQYINIRVSNLRPGFIDEEAYATSFQSETDAITVNSIPINYHIFKGDDEDDISLYPGEDISKLKKKEIKRRRERVDERMLKSQSAVPLPPFNEKFENQLKDDFSKCVSLSASSLPSICFYTLFNTYQGLNTVEISKDAKLVVGGFSDSSLKLWDLEELSEKKKEQQIVQNYENHQQQQQQPPQQQTIGNSNLQFKKKESEFKSFLGHSGPIYGCSFSPDSEYLVSCSEDTTIRLWNMETMANLVCYRGHSFPVWDVNFSSFGYYFASASHDRTARLWATNYINPLRTFTGHLADVNCVKFHPNCNYLATGSSDKSARLWEISTGKCVRIFVGHRAPIYSVAISPDGRLLATAGEDSSVFLWDLGTGKKIKKMDGHTKAIYSLDFSVDSKVLASGSADCTVRLWDVNKAFTNSIIANATKEKEIQEGNNKKRKFKSKLFSEELIETYPTKQTPVYTVNFSRRNLLLASGGFNTTTSFDK
ncbi:transcription initiation factor TFIID subunit [Tieghemostelium lacteum]|uniref:Transcription initiation factor TFIID subunit 5 n=1 Tax=Tieghemostelium lacteum TaxID=361077 RepID=A0A151ZCD6_TIELA|nr:transcription initiation factor TFIID subunit [Tieghemostelium lacteum]|eukprot:KYQ91599.1 transcription initiation factor TFIID subunit [Tieghemostelium lacteum]